LLGRRLERADHPASAHPPRRSAPRVNARHEGTYLDAQTVPGSEVLSVGWAFTETPTK
jgi:hypothetical protein